ncbi:MAG: NUDIX domain-containing protein [Patescibacteria group bacterium]
MREATLAFIIQDNHLLLGEKKRGEIGTGTLNGPGGKQDPGETLVECLVRETEEEMKIILDPDKLEKVAIITFYANGAPDFNVHIYRTGHFVGELRETDDMYQPEWYPIDQLPFDRMLESDHEWFLKVAQGERFTANVYYQKQAKGFERIEFFPFPD